MKWRRVAVLVFAFSLMGSSLLFADSASQKIKFMLNGSDVEDGAYLIDGKAYVPARSLQGFLEYNDSTKRVSYYKPNVHMFLFTGPDSKIFGNIEKTGKLKFNVFAQIDNLKSDISSVRVSITAPDGSTKIIQTGDAEIKDQGDNFWFRTDDYTYDFKATGRYNIGFSMKDKAGGEYVLVSEKSINVLK
jgi:hypothetical protein